MRHITRGDSAAASGTATGRSYDGADVRTSRERWRSRSACKRGLARCGVRPPAPRENHCPKECCDNTRTVERVQSDQTVERVLFRQREERSDVTMHDPVQERVAHPSQEASGQRGARQKLRAPGTTPPSEETHSSTSKDADE